MRLNFTPVGRMFLALALLAAIPAAFAEWAASSPAPFAAKSAEATAFRLAPGAKSTRVIELGEADQAEILAARRANTEQSHKRLQIGIGRRIPASVAASSEAPRWERVPGGAAAHWEVTSSGAKALRLGLHVGSLPPDSELRFAGSDDGGTVYGPFSAAEVFAAGNPYWSPVLAGERALLEVFVPEAKSPESVSFSFVWASHLFASPADPRVDQLAKVGESQFCEVDLVCRANSDAALANIGKAVARITFSDGMGGGTSLCTGTLLNTTSGPVAPYFYSAAHCISTQASASTLATHWFYDRTGCGSGSTSSSYVQVPGGATLLLADTSTDVLFVRLNQSPPQGAVYGGWDSNALGMGTALTAVHHPAGDWKKVSLGSAGGFSAFGGGSGDSHIIALWNSISTGVTEGGSSGSGIFTAVGQPATEYRLRGGLHGGPSSCSATGADLRDYYSRFDRAYSFLSQYLNPGTACSYTVSPANASVGSGASSGSFSLTTASGCSWSATSNASWLTTSSSGNGSGSVVYSVAANTGAARTGTITAGGRTFTVSQSAGQGGTIASLAVNGGFESGPSGWTETATTVAAIIRTGASLARSGIGYAWLGGYVDGTDSIYQDVTIPSGFTQVTLQYWYRITTNETVPGAWDTFVVAVQSPSSGATLATVASYSNQNATSGWTQSPAFDLSAFAGQTVRLRFTATNDSSNISNFYVDDVSFTAARGATANTNYTALWWNPAESGWGVDLSHQGDILFAMLFTYDETGQPLWLVMSDGRLQADGSTFTGTLYRTIGPAFDAVPFTPIGPANYKIVGSMTVSFSGPSRGSLSYSYNGAVVTKNIEKIVFGTRAANCVPTTGSRASLTNYQDLWWNRNESGWGVYITHQDDILFAMLFSYDSAGRDLWLVMSAGRKQPDGSYYGELYRTTGPAFNAVPFTPIGPANYTQVGTMRFYFSDGVSGTLIYSVNGAVVTKAITRLEVWSPLPACS